MATSTRQAAFSPELFSFLSELSANNDREWFAANEGGTRSTCSSLRLRSSTRSRRG